MGKEESLLEGKSQNGEVERPLGESKAGLVVIGEVKLDLSWLAIGEAEAITLLLHQLQKIHGLKKKKNKENYFSVVTAKRVRSHMASPIEQNE
ncbi:unnamed protein product [Malus baccata var. baccata]